MIYYWSTDNSKLIESVLVLSYDFAGIKATMAYDANNRSNSFCSNTFIENSVNAINDLVYSFCFKLQFVPAKLCL